LVKPQLKKGLGAHRYSWNMKVGRFDCLTELHTTNRDLSAYDAAPGNYQVRLTVGDQVQTRNFAITVDPRIKTSVQNVEAAYAERDGLSRSIYEAATQMAKGVRDLRKIKQQLHFVLGETQDAQLQEKGKALDQAVDVWIAKILQKEMRTYQSNYMFEARLLIKFKDFLNEIGQGNLPVSQGMRDVTRDYLTQWTALKGELQHIKAQDVARYNTLLQGAGLPELYWP
jgi:hypothetical protein